MRVLLQRVSSASVSVEGEIIGAIGVGYLLFIGVESGDSQTEATWLAQKIANLRLFTGAEGKLNDRTLVQEKGGALVVCAFRNPAKERELADRGCEVLALPNAAGKVDLPALMRELAARGITK